MIKQILFFLFSLVSSQMLSSEYEGAGIQLYNPLQTHTLLVQGLRSGRWGWTKGHREEDDTSWLKTAIREVKEESGFVLGIHYFICNSFPEQWGKRLYWQGITHLDRPLPNHNQSEHQNIQWVSLEDLSNIQLTKDVLEWSYFSKQVSCDF